MAKRKTQNPYGMGSIREKDGGFQITLSLGFKADGSRRREMKQGFKTAEEAREWANEKLRLFKKGFDAEAGKETYAQYADRWLAKKKIGLKTSSVHTYEAQLEKTKDMFGHIALDSFTAGYLDDLVAEWDEEDPEGSKFVSAQSMRDCYFRMKSVFIAAKQERRIESSPFDFHIPPATVTRKEAQYLDEAQITRILECAEETKIEPILKVLITTGMRIGECLGLHWSDINWENNTIQIQRTVQHVAGVLEVDKPKSDNSKRTIQVDVALIEMLKEIRAAQIAGENAKDISEIPNIVFPDEKGSYLKASNCDYWLNQVLKWAGFEKNDAHLHTFRHSFVALALAQHQDIYKISRHMGHSSIRITLDIYGHLWVDDDSSLSSVASFALAL